ncbi:hypothetical protein [Orenia marismortui]|nr:hypothetical protein [Orenia marismortui]
MSLKEKFSNRLAKLSTDELDKLENMENAINEDEQNRNIKLMVVKDKA